MVLETNSQIGLPKLISSYVYILLKYFLALKLNDHKECLPGISKKKNAS